jgi:hypothetical protein
MLALGKLLLWTARDRCRIRRSIEVLGAFTSCGFALLLKLGCDRFDMPSFLSPYTLAMSF